MNTHHSCTPNILSILFGVVCLGLVQVHIYAQSNPLDLIYVLSGRMISPNQSSYDHYTIWEFHKGTAQVELVYEFIPVSTPSEPTTVLSDREASLLPSDFADTIRKNGLSQSWEKMWKTPNNNLVILAKNELCKPQSGPNPCFGYYEFLLLDVKSRQLRTITKLDYHPMEVVQWRCAANNPDVFPVFISKVTTNPVSQQFVVTALIYKNCYDNVDKGYSLLVDYSTQPAISTVFNLAGGMVWSPDGTHLAYTNYVPENCVGHGCYLTFNLYSSIDKTTQEIATDMLVPSRYFITPTWITNTMLEYPYNTFIPIPDAPTKSITIMQYNLLNRSIREKTDGGVNADTSSSSQAAELEALKMDLAPLLPVNEQIIDIALPPK